MSSKPSAVNLKQVLWDTITELRSRKVDVKHANAVASQAKAIMSVVKCELQIAAITNKYGKAKLAQLADFSKP